MSVSRRMWMGLANHLMRVASAIWPQQHASWRDAACVEFSSIREPMPALSWALGCCQAAALQSLRSGAVLGFRWVRWPLALLALSLAHNHWFSARLIRAWQTEPAWALQFLSDSQSKVVAHLPAAINLLFVATAICYAGAAFRLLRPGRAIFMWYGAASLGSLLGMLAYSATALDIGSWSADKSAAAYLQWLASAMVLLLLHRHYRNPGLHAKSADHLSGE